MREVLRLVRGEVEGVYVIGPDRLIRPENLHDLAEVLMLSVKMSKTSDEKKKTGFDSGQ
jgi:hypothetical protein